ncbi:hypothetical protein ACLOJK_002648 [Asimina triloba]
MDEVFDRSGTLESASYSEAIQRLGVGRRVKDKILFCQVAMEWRKKLVDIPEASSSQEGAILTSFKSNNLKWFDSKETFLRWCRKEKIRSPWEATPTPFLSRVLQAESLRVKELVEVYAKTKEEIMEE